MDRRKDGGYPEKRTSRRNMGANSSPRSSLRREMRRRSRSSSPIRWENGSNKHRDHSPHPRNARHSSRSQSPLRKESERRGRGRSRGDSLSGENTKLRSRSQSPRRQDNQRRSRDISPHHHHQRNNIRRNPPSKRGSGHRGPSGPHSTGSRNLIHERQKDVQIRYFDEATLKAETKTARLEFFSIVLHIVTVCSALMVTIPVAIFTSKWERVKKRCPLFVDNTPENWGNPSITPCNVTAFLPLLIVVLSITLIIFHCGLLHAWRMNGDPPAFASSRKYAIITLLVNIIEAILALGIACTLTDGFRQTCLAFDLDPYPEMRPSSCKDGYHNRDISARIGYLNTFGKIVLGMVGAWLCTLSTVILTIIYLIRAKICKCYLM